MNKNIVIKCNQVEYAVILQGIHLAIKEFESVYGDTHPGIGLDEVARDLLTHLIDSGFREE